MANDAPERIWMDGDIEVGEGYWTRCFEDRKPCNEPALEYIRADHAQAEKEAAVAAAYEDAAKKCQIAGAGWEENGIRVYPSAEWCADHLRKSAPDEATDALAARDARVRAEARRVKPLVWEYDCFEVDVWNETRTECKRVISSEHWLASPAHMSKDYGICRIVDPRVKRKIGWTLTIGMKDKRYLDLESAKAAAQADYEHRVLSALIPSSVSCANYANQEENSND